MSSLYFSLPVSILLWAATFVCHARLQSGWQRRNQWTPSVLQQSSMKMLRLACPLVGLILAARMAGSEGIVCWVATGSVAGVAVALFYAWRDSQRVTRTS